MVTSGDLADWQSRLAEHFTALRARRGQKPLFALEHGLTDVERHALSQSVRTSLTSNTFASSYQLPWVVYATEFGYRYSGDEYWQTFEQETPGWAAFGDRYWLRRCFRAFQKEFAGAEPCGPWAAHFSIICWPITHAILPKDLQRQLARILYEIRNSYSAELFESPSRLGSLIAARSWDAPSRFQNLAEEPALLGQIAAALLLEGEFGTESLIHPGTLARIGSDVERERLGREWLRGARQSARDRAHLRGLGGGTKASSTFPSSQQDARKEVQTLGIEPRIMLRPIDPANSSWGAVLEVPDLSNLLLRFPATRAVLTGARCLVAGTSGRPLARGLFLHGPRRVALTRWPNSDEVLLQFDEPNPQLEYLLRADCLLPPAPVWLFRIATDGVAYPCKSLRVRPGSRYIIVRTSEPIPPSEYASPVDLHCIGTHAAMALVPAVLTSAFVEYLRLLGISVAKRIEVWPAGLSAVDWDGEGHGEWLTSQQPLLAVRADYSVDHLRISLADEVMSAVEVGFPTPGEPVFLELPRLPIGLHELLICPLVGGVPEPAVGEMSVLLRVSGAKPWSPGHNSQRPLTIQVDPPSPTLEQLWNGQIDIEVAGPLARTVKVIVSLFDSSEGPATINSQLPPLPLPATSVAWNRYFERHFRSKKKAEESYDAARICQLDFAAEELGVFSLRCERAFTPVRWAVRTTREKTIVRLIDDTGAGDGLTVAHFSFAKPLQRRELSRSSEYDASADGGLFVAVTAGPPVGVVAMRQVRTLADMTYSIHMEASDRSVESVKSAIEGATLWRHAKASGNFLSATNQREVLRAITRHVMLLIGGERWARAELDFAEGRDMDLRQLKRAVSQRADEAGVAAALAIDMPTLSTLPVNARVARLAEIARSFRITLSDAPSGTLTADPVWLSELALRVASDPAMVKEWAGKYRTLGLTRLIESPTIARAARFLVLASQSFAQETSDSVYAGWQWR